MTNKEALDILKNLGGLDVFKDWKRFDEAYQIAIKALEELPKRRKEAKRWKNKSALAKQYKWERDIAIDQLHTIGYEFGEKVDPCEDAISRKALLEKSWDADTRCGYVQVVDVGDIIDAPSVQPISRWIPVKEKLPEDEQNVLFSTKTGRVYCGKYYDDDSANQWYSDSDKQRAWNNVVNAWMPLPEPYTEEREEQE